MDQLSLKFLIEQRVIGSEYQKWMVKLIGYDFEEAYRMGASNRIADALSRKADLVELQLLTLLTWPGWEALKEEIAGDDFISQIKKSIVEDDNAHVSFFVVEDVLLYKGRLVIPKTLPFIPKLLELFHATGIGGHSSEVKTYKRLMNEVFWVGMKKDVTDFIKKCIVCQQNKYMATSPAGLLQLLPLPKQVWDDITMDFIEGLT